MSCIMDVRTLDVVSLYVGYRRCGYICIYEPVRGGTPVRVRTSKILKECSYALPSQVVDPDHVLLDRLPLKRYIPGDALLAADRTGFRRYPSRVVEGHEA